MNLSNVPPGVSLSSPGGPEDPRQFETEKLSDLCWDLFTRGWTRKEFLEQVGREYDELEKLSVCAVCNDLFEVTDEEKECCSRVHRLILNDWKKEEISEPR